MVEGSGTTTRIVDITFVIVYHLTTEERSPSIVNSAAPCTTKRVDPKVNNRPGKCLSYQTPHEVYRQALRAAL
jgi:IS30 family transposase